MHSAPAVSYPVGRSRFQGWLVLVLGVGACMTGVLWLRQVDAVGWRQWLFAGVLLGACGAAAVAWRRCAQGILRWDGQAWHWTGADASVPVLLTVHLDGQSVLLLGVRPDTGKRLWLWPERRLDAAHWNALRRAVFSRGGAGHAQSAAAVVHTSNR